MNAYMPIATSMNTTKKNMFINISLESSNMCGLKRNPEEMDMLGHTKSGNIHVCIHVMYRRVCVTTVAVEKR
jgi:hypothetical protein